MKVNNETLLGTEQPLLPVSMEMGQLRLKGRGARYISLDEIDEEAYAAMLRGDHELGLDLEVSVKGDATMTNNQLRQQAWEPPRARTSAWQAGKRIIQWIVQAEGESVFDARRRLLLYVHVEIFGGMSR